MLTLTHQNATLKKNATIISYKLINDLFYFDDDERGLRFYVSTTMKTEVFKLTYDKMRHFNYAHTHKRLIKKFYIFNITTKLYKFIRHCFYC